MSSIAPARNGIQLLLERIRVFSDNHDGLILGRSNCLGRPEEKSIFRPAAEAIFKERVANFGPDDPVTNYRNTI